MNINDLMLMNEGNKKDVSAIMESFKKYEWLLKIISNGRLIGNSYVTASEYIEVIVEESKEALNDFIVESKDEMINLTSYDEWNELLKLSNEEAVQSNLNSDLRKVINLMAKKAQTRRFTIDDEGNLEFTLATRERSFIGYFFGVLRRNTRKLNEDLIDLTTFEIENLMREWLVSSKVSYYEREIKYYKNKGEILEEIEGFDSDWKRFWYYYEPSYTLRAWKEFYILLFFEESNKKELFDWYSQKVKDKDESFFDHAHINYNVFKNMSLSSK